VARGLAGVPVKIGGRQEPCGSRWQNCERTIVLDGQRLVEMELTKKLLDITQKRRQILLEMRRAVRAGDKDAVFALAQKLTGLSHEKRDRTHSSFN
jgi:hypothetical protein